MHTRLAGHSVLPACAFTVATMGIARLAAAMSSRVFDLLIGFSLLGEVHRQRAARGPPSDGLTLNLGTGVTSPRGVVPGLVRPDNRSVRRDNGRRGVPRAAFRGLRDRARDLTC